MIKSRTPARNALGDISLLYVSVLLRAVAAEGGDAEQLKARFHLSAPEQAAVDARISIPRFMRLGHAAINATGNPALGLRMGALSRPVDAGIAGLAVLSSAGHERLLVLVGALILIFVAVQLTGWQPRIATPLRLRAQLASGALSGLLAGMTSFVSFPSIPVFVACRMPREQFALVICVMFLLASTLLSTGLSALGVYGRAELIATLVCIAPSAAGQMFGQYVRDRLPERRLRAVVFAMLAAMGVSLVLRGLF